MHSDVSGFSLCKYFRVVYVCLANSVVGCYVFRGVSYLMLCFLMMMFETVLFSSWFVCLMAIAGTVSGLCASSFSLWLLCAAMCCLCLNLSVGSEVCLHSLIKGQAAGSSWHFYDGVLFGVLMSFNVLWLPMLEIVEKLGLHCISFSYALLFSFFFAGVTVLSLHIPGYSCSAAAFEGCFLQKICERAAAALLFASVGHVALSQLVCGCSGKSEKKQRLEGKGEVSIQSTFPILGPQVCGLFELLCCCISGSSRVQLHQQLDVHGFGSRIDGFSVPLPPPILIRREICCCAEFHLRWIVFDRGKCCFQYLLG